MAGARATKNLRGTHTLRAERTTKTLLSTRRHATKTMRMPEIRLTMQLVPSQPRRVVHHVPQSPIAHELAGDNVDVNDSDDCDAILAFRPAVHKSKRKRARRLGSPLRSVRAKSEHAAGLSVREHERSKLPERTWCRIQEMIASAKSLGDITRITLVFFKEHELLHSGKNSEWTPAFPIVIPASEVYNMLVPRKRRIYDVLHVLEGIGIIKRIRYDDATGTKGGSFLYFGKDAAIQHLARIQLNAHRAVEMRHRSDFGVLSIEDADAAVLKMCEEQADVERWPCLTTTTLSFLSLLLLQDADQALALSHISNRLVEAKRSHELDAATENAFADVNRRVYDVVSVLASCDLVLISVAPGATDERDDSPDRLSARKHVRFNYAVFDDVSYLMVAGVSTLPLSSQQQPATLCETETSSSTLQQCKTSPLRAQVATLKTTSAKSKLVFHDDALSIKTDPNGIEADEWYRPFEDSFSHDECVSPLRIDLAAIRAFCHDSDAFCPHVVTPSPPRRRAPPLPSVREALELDTLSALVKSEHPGSREWWWDDSLQDLTLEDALPLQDLLDWERTAVARELEANDCEGWGQTSSVVLSSDASLQHYYSSSSTSNAVEDVDLTCYEAFPTDDDDDATDGYFAFSWSHLTPLSPRSDEALKSAYST